MPPHWSRSADGHTDESDKARRGLDHALITASSTGNSWSCKEARRGGWTWLGAPGLARTVHNAACFTPSGGLYMHVIVFIRCLFKIPARRFRGWINHGGQDSCGADPSLTRIPRTPQDQRPHPIPLSQRSSSLIAHQGQSSQRTPYPACIAFPTEHIHTSLLTSLHTHTHTHTHTKLNSPTQRPQKRAPSHRSTDQPKPARVPLEAVPRQPLRVVDVDRLLLLLLLRLRRGEQVLARRRRGRQAVGAAQL